MAIASLSNPAARRMLIELHRSWNESKDVRTFSTSYNLLFSIYDLINSRVYCGCVNSRIFHCFAQSQECLTVFSVKLLTRFHVWESTHILLLEYILWKSIWIFYLFVFFFLVALQPHQPLLNYAELLCYHADHLQPDMNQCSISLTDSNQTMFGSGWSDYNDERLLLLAELLSLFMRLLPLFDDAISQLHRTRHSMLSFCTRLLQVYSCTLVSDVHSPCLFL